MDQLQTGGMIGFDRTPMQEKSRLDALRLECLKLACADDQTMSTSQATRIAQDLFDFVTDAPKRPDLFAVKRMDADAPPDDLGPRDHLSINGSMVTWSFESFAYRFRSKAEAEAAITSCVDGVGHLIGVGGRAQVVPLPAYFDIF